MQRCTGHWTLRAAAGVHAGTDACFRAAICVTMQPYKSERLLRGMREYQGLQEKGAQRGCRACLNRSRSSALSMEGSLAPMSSTLYLSRMPRCMPGQNYQLHRAQQPFLENLHTLPNAGDAHANQRAAWQCQMHIKSACKECMHSRPPSTSASALARLRPVWPPMVGKMASGRSCRQQRRML